MSRADAMNLPCSRAFAGILVAAVFAVLCSLAACSGANGDSPPAGAEAGADTGATTTCATPSGDDDDDGGH